MNRLIGSLMIVLLLTPLYGSDVSVFAGFDDVRTLTTETGRLQFDNFNIFGVRFEKDFGVIFGFENTLGVSPSSFLTQAGEDNGGLYYTANLVINLPIRRTLPFVTWGLGLAHKSGQSFPDTGTKFVTNWGAGIKIRRVAGPLGLRVEYRRFTFRDVVEESLRINEFSAGLMFTF